MKKKYLSVGLVLMLASSMMFTSCIGSFSLSNKVLSWNKQVGSKFVNELVFFALWIVPVYELSLFADIVVINSIEFWSGSNPVAANTQVIDGKDARYLVERSKNGYYIKNLNDNSEFRFNFNEVENSWAFERNGESHKLLQFVDDTHVKMVTPNNDFKTIELSQEGVLAYQELVNVGNMAYTK